MTITAKKPYVVGYGKPPKGNRFKPGDRANPHGRGKAPPLNLAEVFGHLMQEYITLTDGSPKVSKQEAFVRSIIKDALRCQPRAFRTFVKLAKRAKLFDRPRDPSVDGGVVYVDTITATDLVELRAEMAAAKKPESSASDSSQKSRANQLNPTKRR